MKGTSKRVLPSLVLCAAAAAWAGTANAIPPLPNTRVDVKIRESEARIAALNVLPEWATLDATGTSSEDEGGLGYLERSVRELADRLHPEPRGHAYAYAYAYGHGKNEAKESKRGKGGRDDEGATGSNPGRRGDISRPGTPGGGFVDTPLPQPVDLPVLRRGSGGGRPPSGEVPEPSSSTLLAIAMAGLLVTARRRRS